MADLFSTDIILGVAVVVAAGIAIFAFLKASKSIKKKEVVTEDKTQFESIKLDLDLQQSKVKLPPVSKKLGQTDLDRARSQIRTLTLKQEITSMVLRRLFEAEDEGEISREERIRLVQPYENEMQRIGEDLKKSELVVSLAELESIREEAIKKFEETLNQTQGKIDAIIKELKIEEPSKTVEEEKLKPTIPQSSRRRRVPQRKVEQAEEIAEEDEALDQGEEKEKLPRIDVETRLEQLKKEVMKELDELDKLELEG